MLTGQDHPALLDRHRCAVLVVDMQQAFASHVPGFGALVERAALLLRIARRLGVPCAASEQYPRGLGGTADPLRVAAGGELPTIDKVAFAACATDGWSALPPVVRDAEQFVLVGIEAHVCVRQTALALLEAGRDVHVAVDAVASALPLHRDVALRALARAGARETTVEQAAFDWLRAAGTDEFRDVQALLLEPT